MSSPQPNEDLIIEIIKKVYFTMGTGYKETIYQKCVSIELNNNQIFHGNEITIPINYGEYIVGQQRLDIGIYQDGSLSTILEFKAQDGKLGNKECIQINRYLKNTKATIGYIVNFKMTIFEKDLENALEIFKVKDNKFFKFNIITNEFEERRNC
jgi:GxxExxY protein